MTMILTTTHTELKVWWWGCQEKHEMTCLTHTEKQHIRTPRARSWVDLQGGGIISDAEAHLKRIETVKL